jgi:hypothetical protein
MTNVLDYSQAIKKEVLENQDLMGKLRQYASEEPLISTLHQLGRGRNNVAYSLGQSPSGLWLATREYYRHTGELQRRIAENYCQDLEYFRERGQRTPSFVFALKFASQEEDKERYVLVLEDFTENNALGIRGAESGSVSAFVGSERIYFDFEEKSSQPDEFKYMTDEAMIQIGSS